MTRADVNHCAQLQRRRDELRHEIMMLETRSVVPTIRLNGPALYYAIEEVPAGVFEALADDLRDRLQQVEAARAVMGAEVAA